MMKILIIIAPDNFRDEELFVTKAFLEKFRHEVVVTSTNSGRIVGSKGGFFEVNQTIFEIDYKGFDAIVFVGGPGAKKYIGDDKIKEVIEYFVNHRMIAAICIAPVVLSSTGLFKGRRMTVHESGVSMLVANGVMYEDKNVVMDKNIITANGPMASSDFAKMIIDYFIIDNKEKDNGKTSEK